MGSTRRTCRVEPSGIWALLYIVDVYIVAGKQQVTWPDCSLCAPVSGVPSAAAAAAAMHFDMASM